MIPLPCFAPYLVEFNRLNKESSIPSHSTAPARWTLENVLCSALYSESASADLWSQTLQITTIARGTYTQKVWCEADYSVPKSLGSVPGLGTRVNAIADQIDADFRAQGWKTSMCRLADMKAIEYFALLRFDASESSHQWSERLWAARPLLGKLAAADFDVRPNLEEFFANAR